MTSSSTLPRILVIDDQFGRCHLGDKFRQRIGEQVFSLFVADQEHLCRNFGFVLEGARKIPEGSVAIAEFCPSQRWNDEVGAIENSLERAVKAVRGGWPFPNGERWALVLVDLRFTTGRLNAFGDPETGSLFGSEVIIPELRRTFGEDLPIVVLSSASRAESNVMVRELGALDFVERVPGAGAPPEVGRRAILEALFLHGLLPDRAGQVVGRSLPVLKLLRSARRGARSARTILIEGETGSGKGVLARYIHSHSSRAESPFETFNAAQRTQELQADELFGHWRGAFTNAVSDAPGIWERANGGTVFIDEVADLEVGLQARLMQPIEERRVRRLGHPPPGKQAEIDIDVLVVLATNKPLQEHDQVRKDFLNRVNAYEIRVPALRERKEDIGLLIETLARKVAPNWKGAFLPAAMRLLLAHDWSHGNVRELRNVIERAIANNPTQDIAAGDLELPKVSTHSDVVLDHKSSGNRSKRTADDDLGADWRGRQEDRAAPRSGHDNRSAIQLHDSVHWERGMLPQALAAMLATSLVVTARGGKANLSAAARHLLGRDDVSPMEAKQFFRKCLSLDTRGGSVWRFLLLHADLPSCRALEHELERLRARAAKTSDT